MGGSWESARVTAKGIKPIGNRGEVLHTLRSPLPEKMDFSVLLDPTVNGFDLPKLWASAKEVFYSRKVPDELRVWRIPNCIVLPPHLIMIDGEGEILGESVRKKSLVADNPLIAHVYDDNENEDAPSIPFQISKQKVYILSSSQHWNYFHFTVETLPRLGQLQEGLFAEYLPLISRPIKVFREDSFKLLDKEGREKLTLSHPTMFEEVIFLQNVATTNMRISPYVRDYFKEKRPRIKNKRRRLFVSRKDAGNRRVANEGELRHVLESRNFEIFVPGDHSVKNQAKAFAEAEMIVGAHGAGLANLVYCKPGTEVLELLPHTFEEGVTCYAALSELFGLRYNMYLGMATRLRLGPSADMFVTPDHLAEILDIMIGRVAISNSISA